MNYGYKGYFGFGTEATWGTAVAGTTHYLEINTGGDGLTVADEHMHTASVYGFGMDKDQMVQGPQTVNGEITFDARYEGMEVLFENALGTVVTTQPDGTDGDAYTHVFSVNETLGTGITMIVGVGETAKKADGCMINNLNFNIENTGFLTVTIGVIGKSLGTTGTASPNFPTAGLVSFDQGSITYKGTSIDVISASIAVNNGLSDDRRFIGSKVVSQPLRNTKMEVTGNLTLEFDSNAEYDDFRDGTAVVLNLAFSAGTVGTNGTSVYGLAINCPQIRFTDGIPKLDTEGSLKIDLPFKAYRDGTAITTQEIQITLTNSVTAVS